MRGVTRLFVYRAFERLAAGSPNAMREEREKIAGAVACTFCCCHRVEYWLVRFVCAAQLSDLIRKTQSDLSREDRQRVMCMITIDAHARDIVDKLIREGVKCVACLLAGWLAVRSTLSS